MFTATATTSPVHHSPLLAHQLLAARFVAIDIETGDAPEDAVQAALDGWKPPANVKDEAKIEARREEAAAKIRDKAALLDASPILCIAVETDRARLVFNGMDNCGYPIEGWEVCSWGGERDMLMAFRAWADAATSPETCLVGHNLRDFDAPKIRAAYVRHRLKLPAILAIGTEAPAVDTMRVYRSFSMENRDNFFVGLDTVCAGLGIPRPKAVISGADVPRLHAAGEHGSILSYCCIDTSATARAYLLMTGQAPDME